MFLCLRVWKWNLLKKWVLTKKRDVFLNCIATSYICNYLYRVWNSLSASFIQSCIFTRFLFSQMAKLRCCLGLKYLHKLWQSLPTNKNRWKKKSKAEKLQFNLQSPLKSTAIFLTNLKLWLSTEEFNVIVSLQHGIKTASMGTTGCQMKIMSWIFLFPFYNAFPKGTGF